MGEQIWKVIFPAPGFFFFFCLVFFCRIEALLAHSDHCWGMGCGLGERQWPWEKWTSPGRSHLAAAGGCLSVHKVTGSHPSSHQRPPISGGVYVSLWTTSARPGLRRGGVRGWGTTLGEGKKGLGWNFLLSALR